MVSDRILSRFLFWLAKTGAAGSFVNDLADSSRERELSVNVRRRAGLGLVADWLGTFIISVAWRFGVGRKAVIESTGRS